MMGTTPLLSQKQRVINQNSNPISPVNMTVGQAEEFLENTLVDTCPVCEHLTSREADILRLIIAGKTNKQIAHIFCRSQRTIEYHRNRLMRKLGANTAADLVRRAVKMGIA